MKQPDGASATKVKKSARIILALFVVGVLVVGGFVLMRAPVIPSDQATDSAGARENRTLSQEPLQTTLLEINSEIFTTYIADTSELRTRGLSDVISLDEHEAMLFIFEQPGVYKFWMKDMRFTIDIVWLDSEKRIVHIESNVSPESFPQSFGPNTPTQYVIEFTAGTVEQITLQVGDTLSLTNK